jgi:hypothetical protein
MLERQLAGANARAERLEIIIKVQKKKFRSTWV